MDTQRVSTSFFPNSKVILRKGVEIVPRIIKRNFGSRITNSVNQKLYPTGNMRNAMLIKNRQGIGCEYYAKSVRFEDGSWVLCANCESKAITYIECRYDFVEGNGVKN